MSSGHTLIVLFDVVILVTIILLLCALLPAVFSRNVHRSVGWYNLMVAGLVSTSSYGLLVGQQEKLTEPPFGLCLFQTLLIYAVPALDAVAMLCYFTEFYLIISGLKFGNLRRPSSLRTVWLVAIPWLVFLMIILEVLLIVFPGKQAHLVRLNMDNFYCHLENDIPAQVTSAVTVSAMAILIPLEARTGFMIYQNWDTFENLSRTDRRLYLTVYLRLIICTFTAGIAFTLSMLSFALRTPEVARLLYPAGPVWIALVFGTQRDLLRTWLFWRPLRPHGSIAFNHVIFTTGSINTSLAAETTRMPTQM